MTLKTSNDAEISAFAITGINYLLKYIKIEHIILNCNCKYVCIVECVWKWMLEKRKTL